MTSYMVYIDCTWMTYIQSYIKRVIVQSKTMTTAPGQTLCATETNELAALIVTIK